jgi:hypothetical protein
LRLLKRYSRRDLEKILDTKGFSKPIWSDPVSCSDVAFAGEISLRSAMYPPSIAALAAVGEYNEDDTKAGKFQYAPGIRHKHSAVVAIGRIAMRVISSIPNHDECHQIICNVICPRCAHWSQLSLQDARTLELRGLRAEHRTLGRKNEKCRPSVRW